MISDCSHDEWGYADEERWRICMKCGTKFKPFKLSDLKQKNKSKDEGSEV